MFYVGPNANHEHRFLGLIISVSGCLCISFNIDLFSITINATHISNFFESLLVQCETLIWFSVGLSIGRKNAFMLPNLQFFNLSHNSLGGSEFST